MSKISNFMRAAALSVLALAGTSAHAALIDLGFSLDSSGSVAFGDFDTTRNALADALAVIPTSGANEYRVAVTSFSGSSTTVVAPTIVTAGSLAAIQASVRNAFYFGGTTNTAGAITALSDLFANTSSGFGATTLLNITTDGVPNSQVAAVAAAQAALAAGVDGISFEAIGSGVGSPSALADMAAIAGPGAGVIVTDLSAIPDATVQGFVIPISDFAGYSAAIEAKIGKIVDDTGGGTPVVPLPAGLPLLLTGMAIFAGLRAKRRAAA